MTKKFDHLRNLTASITPKEAMPATPRPKTAPVLTAEATKRMHDAEARAEALEKQLQEAHENTNLIQIPLEQLDEAPGRKRNLDNEQYNRLLENLRHNDLVTPIIVRRTNGGRYEIVSGHNRAHAFKELGQISIPAIVAEISDQTVNKDAFYANLLHSSLPDYEKFLGFQRELDNQPNLTHEELAKTSGFSLSHFSKIMAFGRLPESAHKTLRTAPGLIGAAVAQELAAASEKGLSDRVIQAIELIARNELQQGQAIKFISDKDKKPLRNAGINEIKVKNGKVVFCKLRRAQRTIRLEFKTDAEAERIEAALVELLHSNAKL